MRSAKFCLAIIVVDFSLGWIHCSKKIKLNGHDSQSVSTSCGTVELVLWKSESRGCMLSIKIRSETNRMIYVNVGNLGIEIGGKTVGYKVRKAGKEMLSLNSPIEGEGGIELIYDFYLPHSPDRSSEVVVSASQFFKSAEEWCSLPPLKGLIQ